MKRERHERQQRAWMFEKPPQRRPHRSPDRRRQADYNRRRSLKSEREEHVPLTHIRQFGPITNVRCAAHFGLNSDTASCRGCARSGHSYVQSGPTELGRQRNVRLRAMRSDSGRSIADSHASNGKVRPKADIHQVARCGPIGWEGKLLIGEFHICPPPSHVSASSSAFASFRSAVSKPSVNQP
jgi:hypothetical protein